MSHIKAKPVTPANCVFRFTNWFQWVIDANAVGMSQADILFVLGLCDALEPMRKALASAEEKVTP